MKKPQDSDIFGTRTAPSAPRIVNEQRVDPNAQFQARMDAQYENYSKKLNNYQRGVFEPKGEQTKVNEQAQFDQNYHKYRKDADLQSSIFYEPSLPGSRVTERSRITQRFVPKHAYNVADVESNFGKKQVLSRQVKALPENVTNFKGNSSNIFGYDEHVERNGVKNKVDKLIPHQMEWNDHDSVRYQDLQKEKQPIFDISESTSEVFDKDAITKKIGELSVKDQLPKENIPAAINMKKKQVKANPEQTKKQPEKKKSSLENKVQISILKGWSSNLMQQLSKYCRLNSTKIVSVNFEEGGKGNLVIDRSKRWQCITDWLRKDAKLKIRVMN